MPALVPALGLVALAVLSGSLAACTREVKQTARPERDVSFTAVNALFDGPWAKSDGQTVVTVPPRLESTDPGDPAAVTTAPPETSAPAVTIPTGPAPDPSNPILATIRELESNNNYTVVNTGGSTASGAYQFTNDSWAGFGGYFRAADAPPSVQDTKAAQYITHVLGRGEDVGRIPVAWYIGHVPADGSPEWDSVPAAYAGNILTPRQYQARWLEVYKRKYGATAGEAEEN